MNAPSHQWRGVRTGDVSAVASLLIECGLPADDLNSVNLEHFDLADDTEGRIVGVAGLEVIDSRALLRSLAVVPDWRGKRLGEALVKRREAAASTAGVETVFLLTTTAADFFRRLGYTEMPREAVPAAIASHAQFRSLCPASAKCLAKRL